VLALHPRYVLDQQAGTIIELEEADESAVLDDTPHLSTTTTDEEQSDERAEPDVSVYADTLLLIDALEREDPTALNEIDTPDLVNLCTDDYTICDDIEDKEGVDGHLAVTHSDTYVIGDAHTNTCENRHSFLRQWLAKFRGVSKYHLQKYLGFSD
jgi:transposase-like protein